jgi:hypothetical protein
MYPVWKKALIEGWRAFFPAFLTVLCVQIEGLESLQNLRVWALATGVAAILAGVKSLAKWARETYGRAKYDRVVYNIPA